MTEDEEPRPIYEPDDEKAEFDIHVDAALRSLQRIKYTKPPSNNDHHIQKGLAAQRDCSLGVCAKCFGPIIERIKADRKELACHYCGRVVEPM